jgi:RNA-directed DNA polymerase
MANCLKRISEPSELRGAWKAFLRDAGRQRSRGIDGLTLQDYGFNVDVRLTHLRSALLSGYAFSPLIAHFFPKPNSDKERVICVPTVQDRLVQRVLKQYLDGDAKRYGLLNEISYGFVRQSGEPPRGVKAAQRRAIGLRDTAGWVFKADIRSFFDRIPREILAESTQRMVRMPSLNAVLNAAINCEADDRNSAVRRRLEKCGIKRGQGVRQGMPLSPFFSNVVLREFDRKLISRGIIAVRYADDLIAFAPTYEDCLAIDDLVRKELAKLALEIHPLGASDSKTVICAPSEPVEFLGLALSAKSGGGYELILTEKQLEKIRRRINVWKDLDHAIKSGIQFSDLRARIDSTTSGYEAAYSGAANIDALDAILNVSTVAILKSILARIFGIDRVNKLPPKQRQFLGIA